MKIVLTDAQTVFDDLVTSDALKALGEVEEHGLLRCHYCDKEQDINKVEIL